MTVRIDLDGLRDAQDYFRALPDRSKQAASLAINRTVQREGMKHIVDTMMSEVAFPKNYLKGDRLGVVQFAKPGNLEAVIRGRKRATSLARFAAPGTPLGAKGNHGVQVSVRTGRRTRLKNAWLVRLNRGKSKSLVEDQYNVGLAIYVRPGESVQGKFSGHQAWLNKAHTVALLYGPSVDQVFRDVADKTGPRILDLVGEEFFRQFARLT